MMHAPAISNVNITEWEYIEGITPKFILQYFATSQHPVIYSGYEGRVVFYQTNGSLLLQQLRKADSGVYKATVDLMEDKARTTILEVIGLLPPFHAAVKITVAALVLAVIAAISFVIWLLQPGKHRLGKEVWAWLPSSITGLLGISCLLLFVTSVIWMQEEGPSAVFILHGLCFLAAAMTAVLMAVISRYKPEALACCPAQI
ncbi:UNVERIFIED_CONTAM: hypothetical protein H355_012923, partial [Colinus virginianus]